MSSMCKFCVPGHAYVEKGGVEFVQVVVEPSTGPGLREYITAPEECIPKQTQHQLSPFPYGDRSFPCLHREIGSPRQTFSAVSEFCVCFSFADTGKVAVVIPEPPPTSSCLYRFGRSLGPAALNPNPIHLST